MSYGLRATNTWIKVEYFSFKNMTRKLYLPDINSRGRKKRKSPLYVDFGSSNLVKFTY